MSLSARDTDHKAEPFTYTSLDLSQRSIRLLLLHPKLSESGDIECEIRDATVDDEYICLSYVWGQPEIADGKHILPSEDGCVLAGNKS